MSQRKGFWSTLPGVFTAIGGAITAAVGVVTLGTQLGWLDNDDDSGPAGNGRETTTSTTLDERGRATDDRDGDGGGANIEFRADPPSVEFRAVGARETTVTLRNTGRAAFTPDEPDVTGANDDQFSVRDISCDGTRLATGDSCEIEVTFAPSGVGTYTATLEVPLGDETATVPLRGTLL